MQLKTNRGMVKYFLLSLITFGIYGIWFWSTVGEDLNYSDLKEKKLVHFCLVFFLLGPITCEIFTLVWINLVCGRINKELKKRNINYSFGVADFWLWNVLGALIIVGPFIFLHKLCKAMNYIGADYNTKMATQNPYA